MALACARDVKESGVEESGAVFEFGSDLFRDAREDFAFASGVVDGEVGFALCLCHFGSGVEAFHIEVDELVIDGVDFGADFGGAFHSRVKS